MITSNKAHEETSVLCGCCTSLLVFFCRAGFWYLELTAQHSPCLIATVVPHLSTAVYIAIVKLLVLLHVMVYIIVGYCLQLDVTLCFAAHGLSLSLILHA